ncbi:MAG: HYR domain-containing protein [Candidatus Marinimicrobia bacterium]|nr:HYR domain-containing protein [Candidatus Neomarinimicrobiota bacterium]
MKRTNLALIILTVLLVAAVPAFGQFATTTYNPLNQSAAEGETFSVDINWSLPSYPVATNGFEVWFKFDPSVVQAASITGSAPFSSNELINVIDNSAGTIHYKANGGAVGAGTYTAATIAFEAISAGTSQLYATNLNQYFTNGYVGGVNGGNGTIASVEVTGGTPPPTSLGISGWEMNRGAGYIYLGGTTLAYHGDPAVYAWANIPTVNDANWGPAPNSETIGFSEYSTLPGVLTYADFTYFQTFLSIPEATQINACYVDFRNADDGAQITVFNSLYPNGYSPAGANIRLGGPGQTADISQWIAVGEVNRVVITQVDNQATGNNLQYAAIVLNGEEIIPEPECEPTYQTITILGANGNPGDVDPFADASLDGGTTWQPAILTGGPHPFDTWYFGGNMIPGTNSWINYQQNWNSPSWASEANPLYVDFRIRFNVPEDYTDPSMNLQVRVDNEAIVKLNGVELANISGYGSPAVPEATLNTAIQVGYNEITLRLVDYGGIIAMAYRIDLSMYSCEDLADAVDPSDGSQNQAPVAEAGADQSIDCVVESADVTLSGSGSDADGDDLTYSWSDGSSVVSTDASFTTSLGGGSHTFTLTVSDGQVSASDVVTITVNLDETAPTLTLPGDITQANDPGVCGAVVSFEVTGDDDCSAVTVVSDPESGSLFGVGTTTVNVTATDAAGNETTGSFKVTVEDNEAPSFVVSGTPTVMWPPNHKYSSFDASDFVVSVDDNCSDLSAADVVITRVTSDEAEDAKGGGDGSTKKDMVINGTSLDLRAERQGGGNGRVYTIYLSVSDEHGNSSTASYQVQVPHDKKDTAFDDGPAYEVNGSTLGKFTGNRDNADLIPDRYMLAQNYPNPFNPSTSIRYDMPEEGFVSLSVYDIQGAFVAQLVRDYQSAGIHQVNFDASSLAAGTYLYVLKVNGEHQVRKMLLVK